ncbi:transcriptional regulator, LacI family [Tessaracoccus bendigoensis DSM 12906]|uniref:Transcriptional regulator, LacI family n=1 Tax=Tessaracoccus bendigoensis DSM 12906 TaxID=1123357 RepID=A0A1M6E344_9ACTN|nr:LacI family DNA-binding transcriptional regulator [Tessaracoccus bendigoensis]SHI79800.1 transcriptional regulator, LacI family [Tessaracoccus bendigoensis DSM 12906]
MPPPKQRRKGASIGDVARLAGVSAQTVSRVSTGAENVRPETRQKVQEAMGQLGYTPNYAARALRNGAFHTIGLMAHRFERTGESLTTSAVIQAARAANFGVTIVNVQSQEADGWESAASRLSNQAIDGLVILRAEQTPETLSLPRSLPVSVSDSRLMGLYSAVSSDHLQGSGAATAHLLGLGHTSVHHIAGPADSDPAQARAAGWQRALEQAGIRAPEPLHGDWTAESGYRLGQRLAADPEVTAIFCANDEMAIGALRAFHEAGRETPSDVSVVGFDDLSISAYLPSPLTTVRQDFEQIGHELVRLVIEQIRSKTQLPQQRVVIPTELVVRATTAPPR